LRCDRVDDPRALPVAFVSSCLRDPSCCAKRPRDLWLSVKREIYSDFKYSTRSAFCRVVRFRRKCLR
jgi:hypothetical protein